MNVEKSRIPSLNLTLQNPSLSLNTEIENIQFKKMNQSSTKKAMP